MVILVIYCFSLLIFYLFRICSLAYNFFNESADLDKFRIKGYLLWISSVLWVELFAFSVEMLRTQCGI